MASFETHYFECSCSSDEHTFKFRYDPQDGDLYLVTYLNDWEPWYKRIWKATKYVFGYHCKYGHWDSTMLNDGQATRLKELLERSLQSNQK